MENMLSSPNKVRPWLGMDKENEGGLSSLRSTKKIPPPPAGLSRATPQRIENEKLIQSATKTPRKTPNRLRVDNQVDDDEETQGSVVTLSHIRASKIQQEVLGCEVLLSPVRQSARIRARNGPPLSNSKTLRENLVDVDYAYAPNASVSQTYFSDGTTRKLF